MTPQQLFRMGATAILLAATWTAPARAASISAESMICKGYFGSVQNPQAACGRGDASGAGGGVVIGGSGAGSGINVPFQSDGFGNDFSASAAALQDYGIFRGYAHVHIVEQHPDIFQGGAGARASGEFTDTLTLGGGSGQGRLMLDFTLTGSGVANVFATGGGSPGAQADLSISARMNGVFGGAIVANQSGTYTLTPDGPNALVFTFGVPFEFNVLSTVSAGGGYNRFNPPTFFQADADASFEHTATLTGLAATDLFGNPIANLSVVAASGTHYPLAVPSIPEPTSVALLGAGLALLAAWRRLNVDRRA